jgi:hypothetical protein
MDEPIRARTLAFAVVAALAAAAPAAGQDAATPLEVRGVRAENAAAGGVTITFTARAAALYRRIAGRRTIVRCQAVNSSGAVLLPLDRADELFEDTTAPRTRRPLRIRHAGSARFDVCELTVLRSRGRGERRRLKTVVSLAVPLTESGVAYLEARRLGERMVAVLLFTASLGRAGAYPAAQAVAADVPRLVVLAAPGDSPPPGRVGLYSDGAQHVTVVALTAAGLRLVIDANAGVLTTNVPEVVLGRR